MAQFRDFLEEEGLPANDDRIEFLLPVIKNLGTQKLRMIRLKKTINGVSTEFGDAFRKLAPVPTVSPPNPLDTIEAKNLQLNHGGGSGVGARHSPLPDTAATLRHSTEVMKITAG